MKIRTFKISLIMIATFYSARIFAFNVSCPSPAAVSQQIIFCTQNSLAVDHALECYRALKREWDSAAPELNKVMSVAKSRKNTKQKLEFQLSLDDLEKAQDKLNALIAMTEDNMLLLAKYPRVMLDSDDPADGSVPCYLENRAELEKIVQDLDKKVSEFIAAEEATEQLRIVAEGSDTRIENKMRSAQKVLQGTKAQYVQGLVKHQSNITADTRKPVTAPTYSGTKSRSTGVNSPVTTGVMGQAPTRKPASGSGEPTEDPSWIGNVIDHYEIEVNKP